MRPLTPFMTFGLCKDSPGFVGAGGDAAEQGTPAEEKSVLQALQDLGTHFRRDGDAQPAAAAGGTAAGAGEADAPEPPRQRIGRVILVASPCALV